MLSEDMEQVRPSSPGTGGRLPVLSELRKDREDPGRRDHPGGHERPPVTEQVVEHPATRRADQDRKAHRSPHQGHGPPTQVRGDGGSQDSLAGEHHSDNPSSDSQLGDGQQCDDGRRAEQAAACGNHGQRPGCYPR